MGKQVKPKTQDVELLAGDLPIGLYYFFLAIADKEAIANKDIAKLNEAWVTVEQLFNLILDSTDHTVIDTVRALYIVGPDFTRISVSGLPYHVLPLNDTPALPQNTIAFYDCKTYEWIYRLNDSVGNELSSGGFFTSDLGVVNLPISLGTGSYTLNIDNLNGKSIAFTV